MVRRTGIPLMLRAAILMTLAIGCMTTSPPHPWENLPESWRWTKTNPPRDPEWIKLRQTDYQRVRDEMTSEAVARLDAHPWIAIRPDEVVRLVGTARPDRPTDASPYLVRGVVRGPKKPDVAVVLRNEQTGDLYVFHGLITMELALPVAETPRPIAMVVWLAAPPATVWVDGAMGGDGMSILAGQPDADRR